MNDADANALHRESIIIDGTCPLLVAHDYVDWYIEGGCTVVTPTVGGYHPTTPTFHFVASWLEYIRQRDDLLLVTRAEDVVTAKQASKTGVVLHFQGTEPIGSDLNLIGAFKALGVGIMQLCYNTENHVGFGAQVADEGLKPFGMELIKRCNDTRVIVDCSHTGVRTTMDAIEASEQPVIFSHANPKAVHETQSDRNVTDDQLRAVAASGGLTGVTGFPGFLGGGPKPSLEVFIDHIDHIVGVCGIDHVALGIDYYLGQWPVVDQDDAEAAYRREVAAGRWQPPDYPPPPHVYPEGIETPRTLPVLTRGLLKRGYGVDDVKRIMGLNLVRLYARVWG